MPTDLKLGLEGLAILLQGLGLAFAIPTLFSAHDSVALLAGLMLGFMWALWTLYFLYRVVKEGAISDE